MKRVQMTGLAKVCGTRYAEGTYANIEINGIKIEDLLAAYMLGDVPEGEQYIERTALCEIDINIAPCTEILSVNGEKMVLEL